MTRRDDNFRGARFFETLAPFYILSEPSLIFYKNLVDYNKDLIRVVRRER